MNAATFNQNVWTGWNSTEPPARPDSPSSEFSFASCHSETSSVVAFSLDSDTDIESDSHSLFSDFDSFSPTAPPNLPVRACWADADMMVITSDKFLFHVRSHELRLLPHLPQPDSDGCVHLDASAPTFEMVVRGLTMGCGFNSDFITNLQYDVSVFQFLRKYGPDCIDYPSIVHDMLTKGASPLAVFVLGASLGIVDICCAAFCKDTQWNSKYDNGLSHLDLLLANDSRFNRDKDFYMHNQDASIFDTMVLPYEISAVIPYKYLWALTRAQTKCYMSDSDGDNNLADEFRALVADIEGRELDVVEVPPVADADWPPLAGHSHRFELGTAI